MFNYLLNTLAHEWKTIKKLQWFVSVIENSSILEDQTNNQQGGDECEYIQVTDALADKNVVLMAV